MKQEKEHQKNVTNAAKAFAGAGVSLATAVANAKADGATSDMIREWCKAGGLDSANIFRAVTAAFGDAARLRAPRSDKGKAEKAANKAAEEFGELIAGAFSASGGEGEGGGNAPKAGKLTPAKIVAYLMKRAKTDDLGKIRKLINAVLVELAKHEKAAK